MSELAACRARRLDAGHYVPEHRTEHCDPQAAKKLDGEAGEAPMMQTKRRIDCFRCIAVVNTARRIRPNEIEVQP